MSGEEHEDARAVEWPQAKVSVARPSMGPLSWILGFLSLAMLLGACFSVRGPAPIGPVALLLGLAALFAWLAWRSRWWFLSAKAVESIGRVRVDREGITLDGRRLVDPAAISNGLASRQGMRVTERGGGEIGIGARLHEARRALDLLGLGAGQRASTMRVNAAARGMWLGVVPFFLTLWVLGTAGTSGSIEAIGVMGALACLVNLWSAVRVLREPREVTVGTDAIVVRRYLGGTTQIPLASIRGAVLAHGGVKLLLDGDEQLIACAPAEADALEERLREARQAAQAASSPPATSALLRAGRPVKEWREALSRLLTHDAGSYRSALDPGLLLAQVEDASAPAEARAAAAVALRGKLSEPERARLRIAVDTAADPRVRIALEAADEGDDAAVEEALARVSEA